MDKDPKIDEHIRPRVSDSTVVFNSPSSSLLGLNRGKIETSPFRREPGQGHCRQDVKSKYCKPLNGDFTLTVGSIPVSGDKNSSDQPSRKNESTQTNTGAVDERPKKSKGIANPGSITPTVILNGLAMARGEAVSYQVIEKTPLPTRPIYDFKNAYPYSIVSNPDYYTRNINAFNHESLNRNMGVVKRWIYPYIFHIQVTVGDRSFTGEGKSRQAAKHNAAKNALEVLQKMPIPKHTNKRRETSTHSDILLNGGSNSATSLKSKISILYEKVSASRLKINFEVISETGPPHLKLFQMRVIISKSPSDIVLTAEGTGNNKHSAKTNAAEAALDKIRDTPLPRNASGKKNRSKAKLENILLSNVTLHPSSRLSQIMQAQNKTMPTYKIISSDTTNPHKSSYVTQCVTDSQTTTGHGKSKRDAKRDASEKMLIKLGFQSESVKEDQQSKSSQSSTASKHSLIKARPKGTSMDILPPLLEV